MMAVCPLVAPDDDEEINPTLLGRVSRSVTRKDVALLELLEAKQRIDVDELDAYDSAALLWLAHFGLVNVEVDPADRTFLTRTKEGRALLDALRGNTPPPRKRIGRPPMGSRF